MGPLLIRLLVIVLIVKSKAELQVASSGNQKTFPTEQETCSKVDELKVIVSINLNKVNTELRDTKHQVEELKGTVTENQETVSSELEDTRRKMDELQGTVTRNQDMISSEVRGIRRQLEELQVSVSGIVERLRDTFPTDEARTSDATEGGRLVTTETVTFQKDCSEILARGVSRSGVYTVQPLDSGEAFQVYCDMETDGGGWTVFQRRQDGSVDFYLDFANYSRGFGHLEGEFWLGNDNLHRLTTQGEYELRVDLSDFENESRYAVYDSFSIAHVSDNYRLALRSYSGTAGDSLSFHNGRQFTTKDRDYDGIGGNCAQNFHGAWWYWTCHHSNLNGAYLRGVTTEKARGVVWKHWKGYGYSLKKTAMKIRATP